LGLIEKATDKVTVTTERLDDAIGRAFGQQVGNGSTAPRQAAEI
jgi:hypothetical protein